MPPFSEPDESPTYISKWPASKKAMILVVVSAYSFLGNSATLGPSVYIDIYAEEFGVSPVLASGLVSYPNLAFGFGSRVTFSCAR